MLNSGSELDAMDPLQAMLRGEENVNNGTAVTAVSSYDAWINFALADSQLDIDTTDVPDGVFSILDDIVSRFDGETINANGFTDETIDLINGFTGRAEDRIQLASLLQLRITQSSD